VSRTRSTASRSAGSRRSGSSGGVDRSNRKKEQLYNQAKRLKIEGRSSMTKQQLERAIGRATSKARARAPARACCFIPGYTSAR